MPGSSAGRARPTRTRCAPDSFARSRARRMDPLAARLEHAGDRVLGQPVDLEVRVQLAQLVGDRHVPLRRGRGRSARRCTALAARGRGRVSTPRSAAAADDEVAQQQVDLAPGRVRAGDGPNRRSVTSWPPVASARATPWACGRTRSSSPWITSVGQRTRAQVSRKPLAQRGIPIPRVASASASRCRSRAPSRCSPRSAWSSAAR